VITILVSVGAVVGACICWARAIERDAKVRGLIVFGRDELVPRAIAKERR